MELAVRITRADKSAEADEETSLFLVPPRLPHDDSVLTGDTHRVFSRRAGAP